MNQELGPLSITLAALITHVLLVAICLVGTLLIRPPRVGDIDRRYWPEHLLFLFAGLIPTMLSTDLLNEVAPVFGASALTGIPSSTALFILFLGDWLFLSRLVWRTGGGMQSPYTSAALLLPAIAIFLREPHTRVVLYSALVAASYSSSLAFAPVFDIPSGSGMRGIVPKLRAASGWVTVSSLALTTWLGLLSLL